MMKKRQLVAIVVLVLMFFVLKDDKKEDKNISTESRKMAVDVINDGEVVDTFSKEFVSGDMLNLEFSVNENEHKLTLYSNDEKYRVEVIPTDNGEFLGINFPEGQVLFDNNQNAELKLNTEKVKEYPYSLELDYLDNKICIELE